MEGGFLGMAAFGFWMFIAAVSVGGIWDGIRKREAEHETLRRIIESGKLPDQQVMDKLLGYNKAPERDLKVGGLITMSVAPGLVVLGWLVGEDALMPLVGVAGLVACIAAGLLVAANFMKKSRERDASGQNQVIR